MTVQNLLFFAHTLCMSYVTNTFLLVSSSVRSKQLLWFVHGQGPKSEQKPSTKKFVGFHNHSRPLTMFTLGGKTYWKYRILRMRKLHKYLNGHFNRSWTSKHQTTWLHEAFALLSSCCSQVSSCSVKYNIISWRILFQTTTDLSSLAVKQRSVEICVELVTRNSVALNNSCLKNYINPFSYGLSTNWVVALCKNYGGYQENSSKLNSVNFDKECVVQLYNDNAHMKPNDELFLYFIRAWQKL